MNPRLSAKVLTKSLTILCLGLVLFLIIEPAISNGATTDSRQFTISQLITGEVAFTVDPSNVTMSPSLGGITGGTANGGTQFIITSGNTSGYLVTFVASSSVGMIGNASSSNSIPAYVTATPSVPDLNFTTPANRARFGYTVEASSTSDLAQIFRDDGASCNTGSGDTLNSCWINASTTAVTIINRSTPTTASGATTTIKFKVVINSNPNPTIPNDTYVATTTLTATAN